MSEEPPRVPSVDQLVEVHQALWSFHALNTYSWNFTSKQEEQILPGFEHLADALAPIRQIESTKGWPTRIGRAIRSIVTAFDATTEAWGWEWISMLEPERSAYLTERRASLDRTLDEPILEAALSLADRWADSEHCRFDDLADEARTRGLVPRSVTVEEALAQYREAKERFRREPRGGNAIPGWESGKSDMLAQAWNTLRGELLTISPARVERPPWRQNGIPSPTWRGRTTPEAPTEFAKPHQEKQSNSSDGINPLDETVIADASLRGYTLEAACVRHFKSRKTTTSHAIVEAVCPGENRDWSTVKTWVNRVKNALIDLDPHCRLSFSTIHNANTWSSSACCRSEEFQRVSRMKLP